MNYLFFVVSVLVLTSAVEAAVGTEEFVSRVERNARRLESEKYTPDRVFLTDEQSGGWPGDTEGRTVLALVLEEAALGKKARYLDEIVRRIPAHLNERGYMGPVRADGVIDEQQLSGNGWMPRALCVLSDRSRIAGGRRRGERQHRPGDEGRMETVDGCRLCVHRARRARRCPSAHVRCGARPGHRGDDRAVP